MNIFQFNFKLIIIHEGLQNFLCPIDIYQNVDSLADPYYFENDLKYYMKITQRIELN